MSCVGRGNFTFDFYKSCIRKLCVRFKFCDMLRSNAANKNIWVFVNVDRSFYYSNMIRFCVKGTDARYILVHLNKSFYQYIGFGVEEETSKTLHLKHSFVWC